MKRSIFTVERALLLIIACMQAAILLNLRTAKDNAAPGPADSRQTGKTTTSSALNSRGTQANRQFLAALADRRNKEYSRNARPLDELFDSFFRTPLYPGSALHEAMKIHNEMDRLFSGAVADLRRSERLIDFDSAWDSLTTSPSIDMRERDDSYVVVMSLPGVDGTSVNVTLQGRLLTVAAHSLPQRSGTPSAMFEQKVLLPGYVKESRFAEAAFTNGILRVVVPKSSDPTLSGNRVRIL